MDNNIVTLHHVMTARSLIVEKWGQGMRGGKCDNRSSNTFCAAEAIEDTGDWNTRVLAFNIMRRIIKKRWPEYDRNDGAIFITSWNDAPERTLEDVLWVYDQMIKELVSNV